MAFEPFSLANVLEGAEHIKGMRQRSSYMQLQESALGEDIQNSRSNRELQNRQYTAEQQRANTEWLANSTDRVLADPDPVATARSLIPEAVKRGIVPAGVDVSDGLDLDEIRQINKQAKLVLGMPVEQVQPQSPQGKVAADRESGLLTQDEAARTLSAPIDDGTPSNVREWQFFERLQPEQQQQYLEMKRSLQIETIGQVPTVVRGGGTQPLSTLPAEAGAAGTIANATQTGRQAAITSAIPAQETARAEVAATSEQNKELTANQRTLEVWSVAKQGLVNALAGTETGPVAGRLPAVTVGQQTAEGAIASVSPVLKQLFRTAGEGVFTDRDQQLLLDMVPKRTDHPETAKSKIGMIDAIIQAKLSASIPGGATGGWTVEEVQ